MIIAMQLGFFLAVLGIVWQGIQMAFGTLEQRKFLVGTITKWFLFLFIMTFYPAMTLGLKTFAIEMGTYVSGSSTSEIANEFGSYLESLEKALKTDKDSLDSAVSTLNNDKNSAYEKLQNSKTHLYYDYGRIAEQYDVISSELYSAQKKQQELNSIIASIDTDNPKGVAKTINALKSVLIINDVDITKKYYLDLSMKDSKGNNTGFLSPNAMLRMSILSAQIMWQKVWENDIMVSWEENAKGGITSKKLITDFPFNKIFDLILCFLCELLEIVITCIELIQYVMCIIEFTICITFGIILVPCLLFDGLKDMSMKLLPSLLSQTVKLSMITICMYFCCYTFMDIAKTTIADTSSFNIWSACYIIFTILLTFALCSNAPKLATALLTGQPQMSMGEFVQAAAAIVGGAKLAQTAASRTVGAGKAVIGNASRAAANRLGDVAAMAGGASGAVNKLGDDATKGQKFAAGLKGAIGTGAKRAGSRVAGKMQNAATNWGRKGGSGGGMGAPGSGGSQWDINQRGKGHGMEKENQAQHTRDYAGHMNEQGNKSTLKEYLKSQWEDAGGVKKDKSAESGLPAGIVTSQSDSAAGGGNNFNPPAETGGSGLPSVIGAHAPVAQEGSSCSYHPQIEDWSEDRVNNLKSAGSSTWNG